MQMTLKKCENHFASFMFSYCVIAPPLSPSPSLLRSQLEIKTKIKTNILYANFCVHCRRFVSFRFHHPYACLRLFTSFHKHRFAFSKYYKIFCQSFPFPCPLSFCLCCAPVLPFSRNFLLLLFFIMVLFQSNRIYERAKEKSFFVFFCSS